MDLGRLGVWSIGLRQVADPAVPGAAAELERLGYGTIWFSGGSGTRGFDIAQVLAQATRPHRGRDRHHVHLGHHGGAVRSRMSGYLKLPNYVNNWLRSGYQPEDVEAGGSDRLVDDLVACGEVATVGDRIRAHYAAGADDVCVQVLGGAEPAPLPEWRAIAREVLPG